MSVSKSQKEKEAIKEALEKIRKPNGDKTRPKKEINTVKSIIPDVWNTLRLEGNPDLKILENLLIRIINDLYGDWSLENNKDEMRKKARLRDITLLSFGLLDGYPHTKEGVNTWLSDRYENYLNNCDYIELEYPDKGTYQDIKKETNIRNKREKTHVQPIPLNTLTKISGDGRDAVRDELYKKANDRTTYKQYCNEGIKISTSELTSICYTKDNFSPVVKSGINGFIEGDNTAEKRDETGEKVIDQGSSKKILKSDHPISGSDSTSDIPPKPFKTAVCLRVSTIVLIASVFALAVIGVGNIVITQKAISLALENPKVNQKPYSIKFTNPEEWLPFGKSYCLKIESEPSDAIMDGLRCKSEGDNAQIIDVLSEPALHIKSIDATEGSKNCDVDIRAYMDYDENICDVVTIHIIKNGEIEPTGGGEVGDETPVSSNQKND